MEIAGKNVIITGGARGLGRAYALSLKAHGAKPYILNLHQEYLDAMYKEAAIPGRVIDVANEKEVEAFVENYTQEYGPPHVLINNAGITADSLFIKKKDNKIIKFSMENWEKVIRVNLTGVFLFAREAAYQMVKHAIKGVIINISSITRVGNVGQTNYSATKAAVVAMTVTWTKELSRYGIRVAAIAPGYINTEMCAAIKAEAKEKIISKIPLGRLGEREEINQAVEFIIKNDFFTGRVLEVDGGMRL